MLLISSNDITRSHLWLKWLSICLIDFSSSSTIGLLVPAVDLLVSDLDLDLGLVADFAGEVGLDILYVLYKVKAVCKSDKTCYS